MRLGVLKICIPHAAQMILPCYESTQNANQTKYLLMRRKTVWEHILRRVGIGLVCDQNNYSQTRKCNTLHLYQQLNRAKVYNEVISVKIRVVSVRRCVDSVDIDYPQVSSAK